MYDRSTLENIINYSHKQKDMEALIYLIILGIAVGLIALLIVVLRWVFRINKRVNQNDQIINLLTNINKHFSQ
jgi:TM2 domain-containing membrane protein YozV